MMSMKNYCHCQNNDCKIKDFNETSLSLSQMPLPSYCSAKNVAFELYVKVIGDK